MFKKKPPLNFNEYIYSISDEERLAVLKYCARFGNANQVLCGLLDTPPCYQTPKVEYRINKDFLLWHFKNKSGNYLSIKKIDSIDYCYHSNDSYGTRIGMILNDGSLEETHLNNEDSVAMFTELRRYVRGFENIKTYDPDAQPDVKLPAFDESGTHYMIRGNTLYYVYRKIFSDKIEERILVPDIRDIIWCRQDYFTDSDMANSADLNLYLCNSIKKITLSTYTERDAFHIAMELKKRIPHLLYGPNEEYEMIFKRNPAELMFIATSQIYK